MRPNETLRMARQEMAVTQVEMAALLGVDKDTLARWERGTLTIRHEKMLVLALERLLTLRNLLGPGLTLSP